MAKIMDNKLILFILCSTLLINLILNVCDARTLGSNTKEERECDLLLKRLKRGADTNFIDEDDAYIQNLIKSTLSREKQKCIDKYQLFELPRQVVQQDDGEQAKELKREVAKLKDLVDVVKDQRYILKTLTNPPQTSDADVVHSKTGDEQSEELEKLWSEVKKLQNQLQRQSKLKTRPEKFTSDAVKDKLDRQQVEITNLKRLLQGLLVEIKSTKNNDISTTTEAPQLSKDMAQMLKELSLLEKKLADMQRRKGSSANHAEVVAMRPPSALNPFSINQNRSVSSQPQDHVQGRSVSDSERASEDELDALLNLLVPAKSTSSVDTLLKSLDSDSDDELERRLLTLEKQMQRKKKQQFEEKLKSLEKQLTNGSSQLIQSKLDDSDLGDTAQLKRLLVKLIQKKNQQSESKSLEDDEVLQELKALQKSIKSLSTDDDDLFEDLEEKNLDITLEKLINAGGSGGGIPHRKRKLSQAQIKALRRRIMALKQGSLGNGYANADEDAMSLLYGYGHGPGHGFGTDYGPSQSEGSFYGAGGGAPYGLHGYVQYGPAPSASNAFPYGPSQYGNYFGNSEYFYGNPTNQFGAPMHMSFANYPGVYPFYSGYQGKAPSPATYFNGNSAYESPGSLSSAGSVTNQGTGGFNNMQFFPSAPETSGSSYSPQQNSGTSGTSQSYQNQPTADAMGHASVADLKNQINELQGVINTFNKPEYVLKQEDRAVIYNLNEQINELKRVVSTLQETPYRGQAVQNQAPYHYQHLETYAPPASPPGQTVQYSYPEQGGLPPPPQMMSPPQAQATYAFPAQANHDAQPQEAYQHPPSAGSYQTSRKRRGIDAYSTNNRNEELINTLGSLLGDFLGMYEENNEADTNPRLPNAGQQRDEVVPQVPHVFDDINAKIAAVRNQLDHQVFRQRQRLRRPIAPIAPPLIPEMPKPPQQLRNNNYNKDYARYDGYNDDDYSYDQEKDRKLFKFKKDDKKSGVFDKILDKILNKIIDKLEKAFPRILKVIFGKFEFTKDYYNDGYGDGYKSDYGAQDYNGGGDHKGDHGLAETFQGMGLFGLLPMIIMKFLSKLQYIFQYLQKYKFFKTFLIPAIVLLLAAGGIIFLVWWLQPNEESGYKQISYDDNYSYYRSNHPVARFTQGTVPRRQYQVSPRGEWVAYNEYQGVPPAAPRNTPREVYGKRQQNVQFPTINPRMI